MNSDPLKYRFVAEYLDGETFEQNATDTCATDPKRSAFSDVDVKRLKTFSLWADGLRSALVDLTDGHFEIGDGDMSAFRFVLHEPRDVAGPFRLVFFRRHRIHKTTGYQMDEGGRWRESGELVIPPEEVTFRLGWEAEGPDGVLVQRVMEFE